MTRDPEWHLDKTVSIGHIVTTLTAMLLFIGWAIVQDRRVTTLEAHDAQNIKDHVELNIEGKEWRTEIRSELREIRALIEARNNKGR